MICGFRSHLCVAWTERLARLYSPHHAGPSPPEKKRGWGSPPGVPEHLCRGGLRTNWLRTSHGACTGAVGGYAVGTTLWVSPPGRADLPMRQQADKWRPPTVNISSMMSPLRQRMLSSWTNNHFTLSITVLTVSPFSAACWWSLLGVMPLIVKSTLVLPVTQCHKYYCHFSPLENFFEQSFVSTCIITSLNESVFILRRDCNISSVLAPPQTQYVMPLGRYRSCLG